MKQTGFGKRIKQLCLDMLFSVKTMFGNFQYYFFLHLHRELNSSTDALLKVIIQWDLHLGD